MSPTKPPAIPFPTVEQLARVAAVLATRTAAASNPAAISAEAWNLWLACGEEIQSRYRAQVDFQELQNLPEEWKPEPPPRFPANIEDVLQRILPRKRPEDRWSILRDYLKDNIRVGKLTAYEYGDSTGGSARTDKTLEDFPETTPDEVAEVIAKSRTDGVSETSWNHWSTMLPRRAEMLDRESRAEKAQAAAKKRWSKKKAMKRKKSL